MTDRREPNGPAGPAAAHAHDHAPGNNRVFLLAVGLNITFVVVEVVFGIFSRSLALLADAGHNLSDVLGLVLAWGAGWLATRTPTERHTYGFRRSTILASLANAVMLLVAVGAILWEAVGRFGSTEVVHGKIVMAVAAAGVVLNGCTALLFMSGRERDLNIRGAFLHMAADAAVSVGVVMAGLAIVVTGWFWLDPAVSLVIAAVIVVSTWGLLKESVALALDAVPSGIDPTAVESYLAAIPGITAVHDLHIWSMSTTEAALTVHIVKPALADDDALLTEVCRGLHERFGIEHATLQVERDASHFCNLVGDKRPR